MQVVAAIILYISGCLRHDSMEGERQRVYSEMRQAKEMRFTHMDRVNPERELYFSAAGVAYCYAIYSIQKLNLICV